MPISILILQVRVSVEDHQAAFSFEISHDLWYTILRRDTQQHVDMIWARLGFYDLHPLLFTQLPKYLSDIFLDLTIYCHSAVFWCKDYVVLASPRGVLQTLYIFFFHRKNLLVFLVAVGRPQLYFTSRFFHYIISWYSPAKPGGAFALNADTCRQGPPFVEKGGPCHTYWVPCSQRSNHRTKFLFSSHLPF